MTETKTIHTDFWLLKVPQDWSERPTDDGKSIYLESADGTKGAYLTTWTLGEDDDRPAEELAAAFRIADLKSLENMAGYRWKIMAEITRGTGNACVSITDYLDTEKNHRAVGKILAAPPVVIRATFHDYACINYDASLDYFAPIVDSLQFYVGQG
ncbi:MAG TPA: hypothetical protein VJ698_02945 [Noviherbaspirillum sp.]|uniref:hypothetical protein n=1 Tax=Noviherbaspirillum sp. TaxID=1926288 RepID=UPI002B470451|nr:hypothetical protein [Noviherbaspirillum sp.]HJV84407.1 hypothetical protein [Noviherbaspirillum sp.]